MRKRTGWRKAWSLLVLLLLLTSAAAEDGETLTVQLNGEPVAFTDAYPENRNDRNFLPFRAIFEALGAEVTYDGYTHTATAARNGIAVDVPIGTNLVFVTRNGAREVIEMDVESYIKDDRTYVPVRFMAQALGCIVEWDQENLTVIILDVEALAQQAAQGRDYTVLEGCRRVLGGVEDGNRAVTGELTQTVTVDGTTASLTRAWYSGLTAPEGSQLTLMLQTDQTGWYERQAAAYGLTLAELGLDAALMQSGLSAEVRIPSPGAGQWLYVNWAAGGAAGLPVETWLSITGETGQGGAALDSLLHVDAELELTALIREGLSGLALSDSATAAARAAELAEQMAAALSDGGFAAGAGELTVEWKAGESGTSITAVMDEAGTVTGFTWKRLSTEEGVDSSMVLTVDRTGRVTAEEKVTAEGQTTTMVHVGQFTATEEAPRTGLPEGVTAAEYAP